MKLLLYVYLFLFFGLYSLMAQTFFEVQSTNNSPQGFGRLFSKQVEIFGISIFATATTPDSKILHAAGLLAQYLDNDNDSQPDNQLAIQSIHWSNSEQFAVFTTADLLSPTTASFVWPDGVYLRLQPLTPLFLRKFNFSSLQYPFSGLTRSTKNMTTTYSGY